MMQKPKFFSRYNVPKNLFYSFILLFWCVALIETAFHQIEANKAVPAFQNETLSLTETIPAFQEEAISLSETIPAFQTTNSQTLEVPSIPQNLTRKSVSAFSQQLAQQIDSESVLISSHSDKKYSDFYYYSPILKEKFHLNPISSNQSNLQIVITWTKDGKCDHIYLGMPCIEYTF